MSGSRGPPQRPSATRASTRSCTLTPQPPPPRGAAPLPRRPLQPLGRILSGTSYKCRIVLSLKRTVDISSDGEGLGLISTPEMELLLGVIGPEPREEYIPEADIVDPDHESSIFRSFIQPCMWVWKCQASSPWATQHKA